MHYVTLHVHVHVQIILPCQSISFSESRLFSSARQAVSQGPDDCVAMTHGPVTHTVTNDKYMCVCKQTITI